MYNHSNQYRCDIIRGKSKTEMDNLLPSYAKVIDDICPCQIDVFTIEFNKRLADYLSAEQRKTIDNHRTEIAGKLFGMYFIASDGYVYASDRTKKFLEDLDQPAFFKDICYKMQFPNGMQKLGTVKDRVRNNIKVRPNAFVLKVLQYAKNVGITLSKKELGYYVLNSLDVLQGIANPIEVIEQIKNDRKSGIKRVVNKEGRAYSYNHQHINEQLNYLELANLIYSSNDGDVWLNDNEENATTIIADSWNEELLFNVYEYDLESKEGRKQFQFEWDEYYGKLSNKVNSFTTSIASLGIGKDNDEKTKKQSEGSNVDLGDDGELYVYEYEKNRVHNFNPRLVNKVLALGRTKGLGYDIQSVIAETGDNSEFVKYIEVKSTKRVTMPDINNEFWMDTINLTRNEWVAALQHKDFYSVYRVYFVRNSVLMCKLDNIYQLNQDNKINVVPMIYRLDFKSDAIKEIISEE